MDYWNYITKPSSFGFSCASFCSCISFLGDDAYLYQVGDFLGYARAMLDGQVLYRDLLDHKGVLQFVPALVAQSISRTSLYPYLVLNIVGRLTLVASTLLLLFVFQ